jgi:hypothetical protein
MMFKVELNRDQTTWDIVGDNGDRGFEGNPIVRIRGPRAWANILLPLVSELYMAKYMYGEVSNTELTAQGVPLETAILRFEFVGTTIKILHDDSANTVETFYNQEKIQSIEQSPKI